MLPGDEKRVLPGRKEKMIPMSKHTITLYMNDPMGKR